MSSAWSSFGYFRGCVSIHGCIRKGVSSASDWNKTPFRANKTRMPIKDTKVTGRLKRILIMLRDTTSVELRQSDSNITGGVLDSQITEQKRVYSDGHGVL